MTDATIAREVRAFGRRLAAQPPNETIVVFQRAQAALARATATGVISVGAGMPDGELLDRHGRSTPSEAVRDRRVAIVFHRGASGPCGSIALRTHEAGLLDELDLRGVAPITISSLEPDGSRAMDQRHELAFAVPSDPGSELARRIGVPTPPRPGTRTLQLKLGLPLGLEAVNADETTTIPKPTTLIIEPDGEGGWVGMHPDSSASGASTEILVALDKLA